jgi:transcriptional regulator with XRE-family HTH domain
MTKRRIQELLFENRITQQDLAIAIGITPATLSRNLNGTHQPKAEVISAIAKYFNVSVDYLMGLTDNKNPNNKIVTYDPLYIKIYDELKGLDQQTQQDILDMVTKMKSIFINNNN